MIAAVGDDLGANEAASLLRAGVTTFNALRHSGAMPGDVIAIYTLASSKIGPHSLKEVSMASEQKVAVITGASGGIGAALVEAYRNLNYWVVATARSREPLSGDDVMVVPSDIADRKTAERAISAGMAQFGRIDTLVKSRRKKHAVFRTTLAARLSPQKSQLNRE